MPFLTQEEYRVRKAAGLCANNLLPACHNLAEDGSVYCTHHRETRNKRVTVIQRTLKSLGRCRNHSGREAVKGLDHCEECLEKARARYSAVSSALRQAGRCIGCKQLRGEDGTTWRCRVCADKHAILTRRLRAERLSVCTILKETNHS